MKTVYRKRFAVEELMLEFQKVSAQRDELLIAVKFLISQVETLAERAFSDEVPQWIEKCDAVNCGKRAIANAKIKPNDHEKQRTSDTRTIGCVDVAKRSGINPARQRHKRTR